MVTQATGRADIVVDEFKCPAASSSAKCPTLIGTLSTAGMNGTKAEIRQAPPGQNGPLVATLVKDGENRWSVASGTTLSRPQYDAYMNGNLYVTVDSAANRNGEIRAQLRP